MIQGQQIFRVKYDYTYSTGTRSEEEQVTQSQLDRMRELESKGQYYSNIQIIEDLGYEDRTWWQTWYELGMSNLWIKNAYDPPFRADAFVECKSVDYLIDRMEHGNWCLGTAFFYQDICFINQIDGGDEWLVIRKGIAFECWSIRGMLKERNGEEKFKDTLNRILAASDLQLKTLEYMDAGPISCCSKCQCKLFPGSDDIFLDEESEVCESCWRDQKIYIKAIERKVRSNERLTTEDLHYVKFQDHFYIAGQQDLAGEFICWNDQFAIGRPDMYENRIQIYKQVSEGSWKIVDDYEAE